MEQHYIGVDLHKAFFQACALSATGVRAWTPFAARARMAR
jgi:hypothetical protein